jgi:uncharacterized membrane protein
MPDGGQIPSKAVELFDKANEHPEKVAAAGAALVALPFAAQGLAKLAGGARKIAAGKVRDVAGEAKHKAKDLAGEVATDKLKPSLPGGLGGLLGGGDSDGDDSGESAAPGHGSGRRMPIQQAVDVALPIRDTYNLWTQFEDWPSFMHRVDSVEQVDDATVAISTKVWGITKRFEAEIVEQHPDERIEWDVAQGLAHTGVVSFHKLAPRLTRIEVTLDIEPNSLLEKAGRGMRFTKRAVRGDLHRFKAHAELCEEIGTGWRGTIQNGQVRRKTDRKTSRSSSNGRSARASGRGSNGSGPRSGTSRKSRTRS